MANRRSRLIMKIQAVSLISPKLNLLKSFLYQEEERDMAIYLSLTNFFDVIHPLEFQETIGGDYLDYCRVSFQIFSLVIACKTIETEEETK